MNDKDPGQTDTSGWSLDLLTGDFVDHLSTFGAELERVLLHQRDTVSERERYRLILTAVAFFLRDVGAPRQFGHAYVDLASMLYDLEAGKVHPVLKPERKRKGGAPDTMSDWFWRARICLGMAATIAAGKTQQGAALYVVTQIPEAIDKLRRSKKGESSRNVREWYDKFEAKAAPNTIAQKTYSDNVQGVREFIQSEPEEDRLAKARSYLQSLGSEILSN